jgi:hypothetical protein
MPAAMNAMGAVTLSLSTRRETSAKTKTMAAKMANSISNMIDLESLTAASPEWVAGTYLRGSGSQHKLLKDCLLGVH